MFSLHRYVGDPMPSEPVVTNFDTLAELLADVRANDGLSEDEFCELLMTRSFSRATKALIVAENA